MEMAEAATAVGSAEADYEEFSGATRPLPHSNTFSSSYCALPPFIRNLRRPRCPKREDGNRLLSQGKVRNADFVIVVAIRFKLHMNP
jgi:hypothetical protein